MKAFLLAGVPDFLIDVGTLETYRTAQEIWPGLSQSQKPR
jgi:hypothetical protein